MCEDTTLCMRKLALAMATATVARRVRASIVPGTWTSRTGTGTYRASDVLKHLEYATKHQTTLIYSLIGRRIHARCRCVSSWILVVWIRQ
jgi:hypothetical protein